MAFKRYNTFLSKKYIPFDKWFTFNYEYSIAFKMSTNIYCRNMQVLLRGYLSKY